MNQSQYSVPVFLFINSSCSSGCCDFLRGACDVCSKSNWSLGKRLDSSSLLFIFSSELDKSGKWLLEPRSDQHPVRQGLAAQKLPAGPAASTEMWARGAERCRAVPPAWPSSLPPWVNARPPCSTAAPTLRRVWEPGCFTAKSPIWVVDKGRFIALASAPLSLWCLFNALRVLLVYCVCRAAITAPIAQTLCCVCVRYLVKEEKERGRGSLWLEKTERNLCARCVLAASWMGYVARNYIASVIIVIKCSKCALVFKVNW